MTKASIFREGVLGFLKLPSFLFCVGPAFGQVSTTAASKVNSVLGTVLYIISSAGVVLFTMAIILAGYKFIFVEGTKLTELKGILIGGILFGVAGALAYYFVSGS